MKIIQIVLVLLFSLMVTACVPGTEEQVAVKTTSLVATIKPTSISTQSPVPTKTFTPTLNPTDTSTLNPTHPPIDIFAVIYRSAFGIDYTNPLKYLDQGEQSRISDPTVLDGLRTDERSISHLGEIYRWLKSEFTAYSAGGKTIGVVTVDQLLNERRLGGCHDHGLVFAAVVRELGYPALMARTSSIAWIKRFQTGEEGPVVGHVFVEVYLNDKWVLIDSTNGWYVEEGYDPANPIIPLKGRIAGSNDETYGFYVERKGIDTWTFGIHSNAESNEAMKIFAEQLDLESIEYPEYVFERFTR